MTENNTPRARKSHAACAHPATKVARAKCRRDMKKSLDMTVTAAPVEMTISPENVMSVEEFFAATAITRAVAALPLMIEAAPPVDVTRKNFRDYMSHDVTVTLMNGREISGRVIGWGAKAVQVVESSDGKTRLHPVAGVRRVTA